MTTINMLLIFGGVFFAFSLISRRIQGTMITLPMLFTLAGLSLHYLLPADSGLTLSKGGLHTLAELTLILVLAADASQIMAADLRAARAISIRLLLIALPLIILTGTLIGLLLFPEQPWYLMALLAAILAPTDAALGASIVADKSLPLKVRQGLNIESGLNDGIALPAVLFFACLVNLLHQTGEENWLVFMALQLIIGPTAGIFVGWVGGKLISAAAARAWITDEFQGIAAMALAVLAFAIAETFHGNGFIAAFTAGLTYGNICTRYSQFMHEFNETESQFLAQVTFFLFGILILPEALQNIDLTTVIYAMLSLTVVRMLPVAISMLGLRLGTASVLFMGWFGPRGLASLLFVLLILKDLNVHQTAFVETIVAITVFMSVILHGITAVPMTRWLSKRLG